MQEKYKKPYYTVTVHFGDQVLNTHTEIVYSAYYVDYTETHVVFKHINGQTAFRSSDVARVDMVEDL